MRAGMKVLDWAGAFLAGSAHAGCSPVAGTCNTTKFMDDMVGEVASFDPATMAFYTEQ
ncbi:hypothetical protein DYGSA30_30340 [Dyella sp. GSA-30]|nr:hypothetical protein DYGSA30_30340 [Dyella sp. GSA-30]